MLLFYSTGPQIISTVKKPVKTLEDLKGLKIRATGRPADILKAVGGTPVGVEMADMYDGLQRGVVDGVLSSMEVQKGWKVERSSSMQRFHTRWVRSTRSTSS